MAARHIQEFREHLFKYQDYREARRDFHEAYELLEGYWRGGEPIHSFDEFCRKLGDYFWDIADIRTLTRQLACEGPVGNSRDNYHPSDDMVRATMFLLHKVDVVPEDSLDECSAFFRNRHPGLYRPELANCWIGGGFKAMMVMVYQIRNNLFHGRKLELQEDQLQRNIRLITIARGIVVILLDHLEQAEEAARSQ